MLSPFAAAPFFMVSQTPREQLLVLKYRQLFYFRRLPRRLVKAKYTPAPGLCNLSAKKHPHWLEEEQLFPSVSTIGGGGGTTISSPGRSPKEHHPGIGLHDPLHGRQACSEFNSFHKGFSQISPREGLFSCRSLPKRGQMCDIPAPPPIVERLFPPR